MIYTPDEKTVIRYTNGACGVLAYALWRVNREQGTIGLLLRDSGIIDSAGHACYVLGGYWIDIQGPGTRQDKLRFWSRTPFTTTMEPEAFAKEFIDGPLFAATRRSVPAAMKFARQRLSYFLPR